MPEWRRDARMPIKPWYLWIFSDFKWTCGLLLFFLRLRYPFWSFCFSWKRSKRVLSKNVCHLWWSFKDMEYLTTHPHSRGEEERRREERRGEERRGEERRGKRWNFTIPMERRTWSTSLDCKTHMRLFAFHVKPGSEGNLLWCKKFLVWRVCVDWFWCKRLSRVDKSFAA